MLFKSAALLFTSSVLLSNFLECLISFIFIFFVEVQYSLGGVCVLVSFLNVLCIFLCVLLLLQWVWMQQVKPPSCTD